MLMLLLPSLELAYEGKIESFRKLGTMQKFDIITHVNHLFEERGRLEAVVDLAHDLNLEDKKILDEADNVLRDTKSLANEAQLLIISVFPQY
jgi:hypothetical protein